MLLVFIGVSLARLDGPVCASLHLFGPVSEIVSSQAHSSTKYFEPVIPGATKGLSPIRDGNFSERVAIIRIPEQAPRFTGLFGHHAGPIKWSSLMKIMTTLTLSILVEYEKEPDYSVTGYYLPCAKPVNGNAMFLDAEGVPGYSAYGAVCFRNQQTRRKRNALCSYDEILCTSTFRYTQSCRVSVTRV